jgi:phosphatidylglycerol:prolipoprotein diacylglycerol transferase
MVASWFPLALDPVLLRLGPIEIRWYGFMFVLTAIFAAIVGRSELRRKGGPIPERMWAEMLFYAIIGMIVGARLGDVIVYDLDYYLKAPAQIFATWRGGLSFHGGLIGVVVAGLLLARKHKLPFMEMADVATVTGPIGIGLVKIGNWINGELYGRVTTVPWGVVFPGAGPLPRHPSQLYEAFFEGPVLFIILWRFRLRAKKSGDVFALFLVGYGVIRFIIEFFRQPDGLIIGWLTTGQFLCLFMIAAGACVFAYNRRSGETQVSEK